MAIRRVLLPGICAILMQGGATAAILRDESAAFSHARMPTGKLVGAVFDSTQDYPLDGAVVRLTPGNLTATTDSLGEFTFDGLPADKYTVTVTHRTLTALALSLERRDIQVEANKTTTVELSTPSAAEVRKQFCGHELGADTGALVGRVTRVNDGSPAAGATVSFSYDASTPERPDRFDTVRVTTRADGRFAFCTLPARYFGRALARADGPPTVDLGAETVESGTRLAVLLFTVGNGSYRVRGSIHTTDGKPVARAWVGMAGSSAHAVSEVDGTFTISSAPGGTQRVLVRRVGYGSKSQLVEVGASNEPISIVLRPADAAKSLTAVNVEELWIPRLLAEVGFTKRRQQGKGYFMTSAEFANKPGREVADIFRGIPGLRIQNGPYHQQISFGANRANTPCIYVDGFEVDPAALEEMLGRDVIAAIEVYDGGVAPNRFRNCANEDRYQRTPTLVIWTRWRIEER